jgi:hypothetical protein
VRWERALPLAKRAGAGMLQNRLAFRRLPDVSPHVSRRTPICSTCAAAPGWRPDPRSPCRASLPARFPNPPSANPRGGAWCCADTTLSVFLLGSNGAPEFSLRLALHSPLLTVLGEPHGRNLASALMRSRVHNRTSDRGGKPIRLAWPWALPPVLPEGPGVLSHDEPVDRDALGDRLVTPAAASRPLLLSPSPLRATRAQQSTHPVTTGDAHLAEVSR